MEQVNQSRPLRIGIIAIGSRGDVQPYVALGKGFRRAGYEVRLLTHGTFANMVRKAGLECVEIGDDLGLVIERTTREAGSGERPGQFAFRSRLLRMARPLLREWAERSWQATQDTDALLMSFLGGYIGVPLAHKRGIPAFAAYVFPVSPTREFPGMAFPPVPAWLAPARPAYNRLSAALVEWLRWPLSQAVIGKVIQDAFDREFRSPRTMMRQVQTPIFYGFSEQVLPRPADWPDRCHVTGYWFLDTPLDWQPPGDLQAFLRSGPPPVFVGFGSMGSANAQRLLELVVSALGRCEQRGILLTGAGAGSLAPLPETIFALDTVPHDWLFPQVAAVVHHGGAGTTGAGLRAGLPSLLLPFLSDQYFWGRQISERGLGPRPIPHNDLTIEGLAQAITLMITDQTMRQRAAEAGEQIRAEDGVDNVVRLFERSLQVL
jgi:UDP:flavonoid glycosyltransferase YjiC (YdhE family)